MESGDSLPGSGEDSSPAPLPVDINSILTYDRARARTESEIQKAIEGYERDLKQTLKISPTWELPRYAELLSLREFRRWFWLQSPIAVATGAIQIRHSVTKEQTQLMGLLEDIPFPCRACGDATPKDILHTKIYWLVFCQSLRCGGKVWWIHRSNISTNAEIDTALILAQPYVVKQIDKEVLAAARAGNDEALTIMEGCSTVEDYIRRMRSKGMPCVDKHIGEGLFIYLVFLKPGLSDKIPARLHIES